MQNVKSPRLHKKSLLIIPKTEFESAAYKVIDFLEYYKPNEVQQKLEEWLYITFTADRPELQDPLERSNMMFFYYKLRDLLEANYVLFKRQKSSGKAEKVITTKSKRKVQKTKAIL